MMKKEVFYNWLFLILPVLYFLTLPISTGDLAVWIAQGKYLLQSGSVLRHDIYSVMPTLPLVYPVGTCAIYALIFSVSGIVGVSIFHKFILFLIGLIWRAVAFSGHRVKWSGLTFFIILLSWFGSSFFWVERPALLGMLPFLVSYIILDANEDLRLWNMGYLILISILWVNVHGSWPLLFIMVIWKYFFNFAFFKKKYSILDLLFISCLAFSVLINPFGKKIFEYVLLTIKISKERKIDEWASVSVVGNYQSQAIAFIVIVLFISFILISAYKKDKWKFQKIIASPFFIILILGFLNIRNTALPFFILIPFASIHQLLQISSVQEEKLSQSSKLNTFIIGILLGFGVLLNPPFKKYIASFLSEEKKNYFDSMTPVEAALYLNQTEDSGPVFNDWEYGSYLILAQKHPIFIDTRNIIYEKNEFLDYQKVITGSVGWEQVLEKYKIRYVLLEKKTKKILINKLFASQSWDKIQETEKTILLKLRR